MSAATPPGWQPRVDRLRAELAELDPTASLHQLTYSGVGPKALWSAATDEATELIWYTVDELRRTCRECGSTEDNLMLCSTCRGRG